MKTETKKHSQKLDMINLWILEVYTREGGS